MYTIILAPEVLNHLRSIERKYHPLIRREISIQLKSEPGQPTQNRKLLLQPAPFDAIWELRCGPHNRFRVFYEVSSKEMMVYVLAIGVKEGNRLWVGGKEYMP